MQRSQSPKFSKWTAFLALVITLIQSPKALASLQLDGGSYANRTHIDTAMRRANLNFIYNGCDPNPSPSRIRIKSDGNCRLARNYNLNQEAGNSAVSGTVGELVATYEEPSSQTCANPVPRRLHSNVSLESIYETFQKQQCFPTYFVLKDGDGEGALQIAQRRSDKGLCKIPDTRIKKEGFPTEDFDFFNLRANESGFRLGDHTTYRYDYDSKNWCVKHRQNDEKCGQWPSPLPMLYQGSADRRFHVKGTITLSPDGKASVRAIDKSYPSLKDVFSDQKMGGLTQTDVSRGRIDFHTWRNINGLVRSNVSSYETDEPRGHHQRSLNFIARNVMGIGITNSWCPQEHCFIGVKSEGLQSSSCNQPPLIDISRGGNGNTCHSCIGITPGLCALQPEEVQAVRARVVEDEDFKLLATGEYQFNENIDRGLEKNFSRIVSNPRKPGCHQGYAPAFTEIFDPGAASRSVNALDEKQRQENKKKPSLGNQSK